MGFDFGAEVTKSSGNASKQPEVGTHFARMVSVVHIGEFQEITSTGDVKTPANYVMVEFELCGEGNKDHDGVTPLSVWRAIPLRSGDRANVNKLISALDPQGTASGFDDLIDRPCQVSMKGSDEKSENGKPKYVNFDSVTSVPSAALKWVEPSVGGQGHVRLSDLKVEQLLALRNFDVQRYVIGSREAKSFGINLTYEAGGVTKDLVEAIREKNPKFGMPFTKGEAQAKPVATAPVAPPALSEDEEF